MLKNVIIPEYTIESEIVLKKGERAILIEDYMSGDISLEQFEERKAWIDKQIERLEALQDKGFIRNRCV